MIKEQVEAIEKDAQTSDMTFETYYKRIKATGLSSYKVEVPTLKGFYYSKEGDFIQESPFKYVVAKEFKKPELTQAFKEFAADKTDYFQLSEALAKNGCHHYVVDLTKDVMYFFNKSENEKFEIKIAFPKK